MLLLLVINIAFGQPRKAELEVVSDAFGCIRFESLLSFTEGGLQEVHKLGRWLKENSRDGVFTVAVYGVTTDSVANPFLGVMRCRAVIDGLIEQGAKRDIFVIAPDQVKGAEDGVIFSISKNYRNVLVTKRNGERQQKHVLRKPYKRVHYKDDVVLFDSARTVPSLDGRMQLDDLFAWIEKHKDKSYQVILYPNENQNKSANEHNLDLKRCKKLMDVLKSGDVQAYIRYPNTHPDKNKGVCFYIEQLSYGPENKTEDDYFKN
jgi:hypothetical protein